MMNDKKKIGIFTVSSIIIAVLLACVTQFFIIPAIDNHNADNKLKALSQNSGNITPANTKLISYKKLPIQGVNSEQKALSTNNKDNESVFIFNNSKTVKNRKIVDVYFDFSSQKSRDFLLINQNLLTNLIQNGTIELRLHSVPTNNSLTMYSAEALAESFYTDKTKSWNLFYNLLKNATANNSAKLSNNDNIKNVYQAVQKSDVKGVDEDSLKNGTFASWIINTSNDKRLKTGFYPPLIYVNSRLLDTNNVNINNPSDFGKVLNG